MVTKLSKHWEKDNLKRGEEKGKGKILIVRIAHTVMTLKYVTMCCISTEIIMFPRIVVSVQESIVKVLYCKGNCVVKGAKGSID